MTCAFSYIDKQFSIKQCYKTKKTLEYSIKFKRIAETVKISVSVVVIAITSC